MQSKKKVYLAGNITKADMWMIRTWRAVVCSELRDAFVWYDPLESHPPELFKGTFEEVKEIVELDRRNLLDSDILLAVLDFPSLGVACEIAWAAVDPLKKHYIILCSKEVAIRESSFIAPLCDVRCASIGEVVACLRKLSKEM